MIETMPAELAENLIDFCENRSRVYALLSRCYETEIDAAFAEALAGEAALASDDAGLAAEPNLALVFGTEGDGLAPTTIAACDYTVRIPMQHHVDSLNVAAASAVAFWELRR